VELSFYCFAYYGGSPTIRLGIYNSDGTTLIGQGSAAVTVTGASDTWQGHMTAAQCSNMQLTGGSVYLLIATMDATGIRYGYSTPDSVNASYRGNDYTAGFPASITQGGSSSDAEPCIRCDVNPASIQESIGGIGPLLVGEASRFAMLNRDLGGDF
jgi:hypothetical protein